MSRRPQGVRREACADRRPQQREFSDVLLGLAALFLVGCSSAESGPTLPYALTERPMLPFPTDALLVPDATSATGLRMKLGPRGTNLGDVDEAIYLFGDDFALAFGGADGWSTLGPVFVETGVAVDESTIEDHFMLVDLEAKKVVATNKRAFGGMTEYGKKVQWMSARSPIPLAPKTKHAIVVTRGLRTASGEEFVRDATFDRVFAGETAAGVASTVASAVARLGGVREALEAAGVSDVLLVDTFTTQSVRDETDVLVAAYRAERAPVVNVTGVFTNPADDPRWEAPMGHDHSAIRAIARAEVEVPNYRANVRGKLMIDKMQAGLQSWERVEALVSIPNGAGPFPTVTYQHGVGDHKEQMWRWANELAAEGVVMIAFDAPLHGFRTDRPRSAATDFINIVDPSLVVDNFRQAEAEHTYLVRVIDAVAAADLFGDGSHPIDTGHLFWMGHSLGSMIGSVAIGLEPRYEGGVLLVGGGTMLEFFDRVLGGFALDEFPAELFVTVAQAAMDKGDPTNYAQFAHDKQILLMQAMEDATMPPKATEALGLALGVPQVAPVFERIEGVDEVTAPVSRRGWAQYSPARHTLAYEPDDTPEAYAASRERMFHFIGSWARTGTAEIR